jgi:hypothetical protein
MKAAVSFLAPYVSDLGGSIRDLMHEIKHIMMTFFTMYVVLLHRTHHYVSK